MFDDLEIVILAAGKGTRMNSDLPKCLHLLGGKPLLKHLLDKACTLTSKIHIVVGYKGEEVIQALENERVNWIWQRQQKGTGHAVAQALPHIHEHARVLILAGDCPLISTATMKKMLSLSKDGIGLLTVKMKDPSGYGRILRDAGGHFKAVVEQSEATETEKAIDEINTGVIIAPSKLLTLYLPQVDNKNRQGEFFLPDIFPFALRDQIKIETVLAASEDEVRGINDLSQLAEAEKIYAQMV